MKKQSQFLKISILFLTIVMLLGCCNVFANSTVNVTANKATIEVGANPTQEITIKAGEEVELVYQKSNGKDAIDWIWFWNKESGENDIISINYKTITALKAGTVKYSVRNTFGNLKATIIINVVEPELHILSTNNIQSSDKADINKDGFITTYDLKLLKQAVASNNQDTLKYDINGDGVVSNLDVEALQTRITTYSSESKNDNLLYNGQEVRIKILEEACGTAWGENFVNVSNLEYTANLIGNGNNFAGLSITSDPNDNNVAILKISDDYNGNDTIIVRLKIKDESNKEGNIVKVDSLNNSKQKIASIILKLENRVVNSDNWELFINDGGKTASINKYKGSETTVTIPKTVTLIDGQTTYSIDGIKANAFNGKNVTKVIIEDNIVNIEAGAFTGASKLTEIKIASSGNKYYRDIDGVLYKVATNGEDSNNEAIIKYPEGKTDSEYTIVNMVNGSYIAKEAFANSKLTKITMPDNIAEIREGAFKNSTNLVSLVNSTTYAYNATKLREERKSPNLSNSLVYIGKEAFYGCSNLTVTIPTLSDDKPTIVVAFDKKASEIGVKKIQGVLKEYETVDLEDKEKYAIQIRGVNAFKGAKEIQYYSDNDVMKFYADVNSSETTFKLIDIANSAPVTPGVTQTDLKPLTLGDDNKYWVEISGKEENKYAINAQIGEKFTLGYYWDKIPGGISTKEYFGTWSISSQARTFDSNVSTTNNWTECNLIKLNKGSDGVNRIVTQNTSEIKKLLQDTGNTSVTIRIQVRNSWLFGQIDGIYDPYVYITISGAGYKITAEEGTVFGYNDTNAIDKRLTKVSAYEGLKKEYVLSEEDEGFNIIKLGLRTSTTNNLQTGASWSILNVKKDGQVLSNSAQNEIISISQEGIVHLKAIPDNLGITASSKIVATVQASYAGETEPYTMELTIKPRNVKVNNNTYYIKNENAEQREVEFLKFEATLGEDKTLNIPGSVSIDGNTYEVTSIAKNAIQNREGLEVINIQIDTAADACKKHITKLDSDIINNCINLKTINISKYITEINPTFAKGNAAIEAFTIAEDNEKYKTIDGVIYSKDGGVLVLYPVNKTGAFTIPQSVNEIGDYAFYNNKNLTNIELDSNVTKVGKYAFAEMKNSPSIMISPSIIELGDIDEITIDSITNEELESEKQEEYVISKMKEKYDAGEIGHVFSNSNAKVLYDDENIVLNEYAYYFGNINKDGTTQGQAAIGVAPEATFIKLDVAQVNIVGNVQTGKYYVGEDIEEDLFENNKIQITYVDNARKPEISISKDMLYYKDSEENWKSFKDGFTKEMIGTVEIFVVYSGKDVKVLTANVESGKLEAIASEELAWRYLQGNTENPNAYIDEEKVKEQLTVYKLTSKYDETKTEEDGTNSEKIKLTNEEYNVTVGEDKLVITCPANAASAEIEVTTYAESEVEKFENLSDEDYAKLKELLKDNIVYFDDETKTIVIPKEDIENKDIPQLSVKLTKNPDKKFYINGKAGDETVSLAGAEIEILLPMTSDRGDINDDGYVDATDASLISRFISESTNITFTKEQAKNADVNDDGEINEKDVEIIAEHDANEIELPRILKVISVKDSKSITIPEANIDKLLETQTEGKTADIKEQTILTLKPNYNGIELSEFNIIVEPAEIESIYVAETFAKKEYLDGEKFQKAGFKLMANYAGEIEDAEIKEGYVFKIAEDIIEDNITEIKPENGSKTAKYTVTVEYLGNTANVCDIEVKETILKDVQITIPNKNFVEGQEPIKNGMTVTLTYVNKAGEETKKTLTKAEEILEIFKIEPEKLKVADTKITVTYKNNTDLKQEIDGIKVAAKAITKVELNAWDNMPEQYVGKVNWEGASLKVTYNDGEVKDVLVKDGLASKKLVVNGIEEGKEGTFNVTAVYEGVNATGKWTMNFAEEISKLEIVNLPKTEYLKDSYIDLSGGVLKVTYAREGVDAEEISMADEKVTLEGGNIADSAKTLTVKYKNKTADFDITLIDTGLIEFTGLEITQEPTKTEYKVEEFVTADLSNGKVKISYNYLESDIVLSDILDMANSEFIEIDESAITDNTKLGEYDIKVKAKDNNLLEDTFKVYIKDRIVTEINAVGTGLKGQTYYEGQTLDKNKITVLVTYDDDTTEPITGAKNIDEKFVIEPEVLTKDTKELIVKYKENQEIISVISLTDKIEIIGIKQVTVQPEPIRKTYLVGEELDVTGGKLHVEYDDGKQEDLDLTDSKITIAGFNSKKPGESIVTVGYANAKALFKVNVITKTYVYEITLKDYQTAYDISDSFNRERGIIEVKHNIDKVFEVPFTSKYVEITEPDLTTEGTKEVTVKYAGKEAKYTVNVTDNNIGSIAVKTVPIDMKYLENTQIDLDGIVVVLKSKGGRELRELTKEEYIVQFPEKLTKENKDSVIIKYKEDETFETKLEGIEVYTKEEVQEFNLTKEEFDKVKQEIADKLVNAEEVDGKMQIALIPGKITIKVEKPANDAEYVVGGELETSRYKVVIYYGEGEQPVELTKVALEDSMVTADGKPYVFAESTSGQEVEITAKYLDAEAKFKVKVADSTVVSIAIEGEPTKTKYLENEEFNFDGIKVVGKNKDGVTVKTLTSDEFTIEPTKLLKGLDRTITIKAKENSSWVAQIRGINVYGQDEVKEFTIPMGDYNAIKDSIEDVLITKEELADGNIKVQLVPGKVSIEVRAIYDKEYKVGDTLDLSNYKVIVNYGEGDSKLKITEITLTESMLKTASTFTKEQAGTAVEIAIEYLGAQTSFKVNVAKVEVETSISIGSLEQQTVENVNYLRIEDGDMTVLELKQIIEAANKELELEIEVLDANGSVVADTEIFATGMTIRISSDTEEKEFVLAKVGYTNTDNKLTISDLMKLLIHLAEENADSPNTQKLLKGAYWVAADVTGDGKVNMFDIIPLVNLINNK